MSARHKKMVDVTVRLNVGIAHDFPVNLGYERVEVLEVLRP